MPKEDLKGFELKVSQISENTLLKYKNEISSVLKQEDVVIHKNINIYEKT